MTAFFSFDAMRVTLVRRFKVLIRIPSFDTLSVQLFDPGNFRVSSAEPESSLLGDVEENFLT